MAVLRLAPVLLVRARTELLVAVPAVEADAPTRRCC